MKVDDSIIFSLILNINKCVTVYSLLELVERFFKLTGAVYFNYTHLDTQYNNKSQFLMHHNYTPEWVKTYISQNYASIDPMVLYGKIYNHSASWGHACNIVTKNLILNAEQKQLMKDMIFNVFKHNLANGIGIAVERIPARQYGFYIAYPNSTLIPDCTMLDAVCYMFNNAFAKIANINYMYDSIKYPFSPQERVVIKLIYQGKERKDIAEITNISVNTVDTMTKRIFIKMRVNSKIQLIAKIISKGWLNMLL